MKADPRFSDSPKSFWATVRSVSQDVGYTIRGEGQVKVPTFEEIKRSFRTLHLNANHLEEDGRPTEFATHLMAYFTYRADVLNNFVEPRLMDAARAKREFDRLFAELQPTCPLPMNKQKGDMRAPAFLTGIVNMIVQANIGTLACDYDPRELTTVTMGGLPIRTLARRVDGALPQTTNPVAIWEIKEYYYTTTFGSRVADGVYETLLDGMELENLREDENIHVSHCLMLDAHYTWWGCGKSYLCRIIDMLNMGYADEVLFGYEVVEALPAIVRSWVELINNRTAAR